MPLRFWGRLRSVAWFCVVFLPGCGGHVYHVVEPGETLYSIGWVYGYDYRDLARWNSISEPYVVHSGQRLRVAPGGAIQADKVEVVTAPVVQPEKPEVKKRITPQVSVKSSADNRNPEWQWPTQGRVLNYFSSSKLNKGIDIEGELRQPIVAAASGKVVYSGTGLVGMGRLIIINHSSQYLSAYAHNDEILVKEGQWIKKGELIARMGRGSDDQAILHFEIRREGKPVDPLKFLPGIK